MISHVLIRHTWMAVLVAQLDILLRKLRFFSLLSRRFFAQYVNLLSHNIIA